MLEQTLHDMEAMFLTLVTAAGGFARARADTATDAALGVFRAFSRSNGIELHYFLH
jgi:hypothetical protein